MRSVLLACFISAGSGRGIANLSQHKRFVLKVGAISRGRYNMRVRELVEGNALLEAATVAMLKSRAALRSELANLEREVRGLARDDPVCRLLMTMPGIGAVVAVTFKFAVDDPARFKSSERVGPWWASSHRGTNPESAISLVVSPRRVT